MFLTTIVFISIMFFMLSLSSFCLQISYCVIFIIFFFDFFFRKEKNGSKVAEKQEFSSEFSNSRQGGHSFFIHFSIFEKILTSNLYF